MSRTNSVHLIGRLGNNPIQIGNGRIIFSVATEDTTINENNQEVPHTNWHQITTFGNTAKVCVDYLRKSQEVALEGKLTYRSWEDKDGNKKYITEIEANQVLILDKVKG